MPNYEWDALFDELTQLEKETGYTFSKKIKTAECISVSRCSQWTEKCMEVSTNESSDRNRFFERQFKFY